MFKFFIAIPVFIFFVFKIAPVITDGDNSEIITAASTLGVAHSPGYPLNTVLLNFLSKLLPFGNEAYRLNISNFLFVFFSFFIILGRRIWLIAPLLLSPLFYRISLSTEVFGVYMLLVSLICRFSSHPLAYFIFGLGSGSNHIVVFLLPFLLLKQGINLRKILYLLIGAGIVFFIPLRAYGNPVLNWDEPYTLQRFLWSFLRKRYGTFSLAMGGGEPGFEYIPHYIIYTFKRIFSVAGLGSVLYILTLKDFKFQISFFISFLPVLVLSNLRITPDTEYILDRFLITAVILFIYKIIENKTKLLLLIFLKLYELPDYRGEFFLSRFADDIFKNTPPRVVLISDRADEAEFAVAYKLYVERKRQDFTFIDANASVTKSYYGSDYYRIWGKPKILRRMEVEGRILKNAEVFYLSNDPGIVPYKKYKFGFLYSTSKNKIRNFFTSLEVAQGVRSRNILISGKLKLFDYFIDEGFIEDAFTMLKDPFIFDGFAYGVIGAKLLQYGFDEAVYFLKKSQSYEAVYNLGVYYYKKSNYLTSLQYFLKAYEMKKSDEAKRMIEYLRSKTQ